MISEESHHIVFGQFLTVLSAQEEMSLWIAVFRRDPQAGN